LVGKQLLFPRKAKDNIRCKKEHWTGLVILFRNLPSHHRSGHWIQSDFNDTYILSKTRICNTNEVGKLNTGFKDVIIDYSEDGINWTNLGTFEFQQGTGNAIYGGFDGPDFEAVSARFVLLTAISNWGDSECFGLAEVKFNITTELAIPEPQDDSNPQTNNISSK